MTSKCIPRHRPPLGKRGRYSPKFEIIITSTAKKNKRQRSEIKPLHSPPLTDHESDDSSAKSTTSSVDPHRGSTPVKSPQWNATSPLADDPPAFDPTCYSQSPVIYDVADDELIEDENLQIIGETDATSWSDDSDSDTNSEVPVRLFKDFVIYDFATNELVPVAALAQLSCTTSTSYGGSGIVEAWVDDVDGEEEDDEDADTAESDEEQNAQVVKLSKIIEFNTHHYSKEHRRLDGKIYIRTEFAWYILDTPSTLYSPFYSLFWIQHRILHLIVTQSLENPRLTYEEFIESLEITPEASEDVAVAMKVIGRALTESDVQSDDVNSYISSTLRDLRDQDNIKLDRVPLIRTVRGDDPGIYVEPRFPSQGNKRSNKPKASREVNLEKDVLHHRNPTVVTPRVGRIAQGLFELTLRVAGQSEENDFDDGDSDIIAQALKHAKVHHQDPMWTKWVEPADSVGYYNSVIVDGVVYSVGDVVTVNPGTDEDRVRANNAISKSAQTKNALGNRLWFCKICHFFQKKGRKWFHGQWLAHGSKTLLQETAHPQSLFLMDSCDDIPLASIFQKCNLRWLQPEDEEPPEDDQENNFHCALMWNEDESSFTDLPSSSDAALALASCPEGAPCVPCGRNAQQELNAQLRPLPGGGFSHFGQKYHVGDFVYIKPDLHDGRYEIAQIIKIRAMKKPVQISVVHFGWYDDIRKTNAHFRGISDERRLVKTSQSVIIAPDEIDGLCYVSHLTNTEAINEWVRYDDHYYANQLATSPKELCPLDPSNFLQCKTCLTDRINTLRTNEQLLARHKPLRGLELFSGAGGLGTGLDMSGFVETKIAIEFSPSAAKTYALNHPQTKVFNQCTNLLLQHAIDCYEGKNPPPLTSLHNGRTRLEAMPEPGEIDFIYGGPPCQSFSGANRWKKANDVRSTLVCNMLSYVEFYRPSYFQLENVTGLLQFPLNGRQVERTIVDGIKMGVVKFIERTLIGLGYQVRSKVLEAGQYGAPQGRKRVIFWGARRGALLPGFPLPTHSFKGSFFYQLPTGNVLPPVTRSKNSDTCHQIAPLKPVTVNDAINDLPAFDWKNPHQICPATAADKADVAHRTREHGIPAFEAVYSGEYTYKTYPGYESSTPYACPPQNRYQMWMRREVGHDVQYHYTRKFAAAVVERAWNIPLDPNADHTNLPLKLRPRRFDGKRIIRKNEVLYGRIDGHGFFRTALTTVSPNAKASRLLHPSQKRILTVRECARAQGFPDHYKFVSVNKKPSLVVQDQHRQIGNAVPVPLSLALGKSLGETLLKMWVKEERAGSSEI